MPNLVFFDIAASSQRFWSSSCITEAMARDRFSEFSESFSSNTQAPTCSLQVLVSSHRCMLAGWSNATGGSVEDEPTCTATAAGRQLVRKELLLLGSRTFFLSTLVAFVRSKPVNAAIVDGSVNHSISYPSSYLHHKRKTT